MSVVAKFFIQSCVESPGDSRSYTLGAVCRGETNKDWAAATPSGSMKHTETDFLAMTWREFTANRQDAEVFVHIDPADDGEWIMDKCDFSYGGCVVHFRQREQPWGELSMTINATGATKVLRQAYADSLLEGNPAKFAITFDS